MSLFLTSGFWFVCFCSIGVCVCVYTCLMGIEARALHMHTDVSSCETPTNINKRDTIFLGLCG